MTNIDLPQVWSEGIIPLDQKHRELFDLLNTDEREAKQIFFKELYGRFSVPPKRKKEFLEQTGTLYFPK